MDDIWGSLNGYKPEKIKEGFDIIKGTFNCRFNFFRIEPYEGEIAELQGTEVVRYELGIVDEGEFMGRRVWKRFYLGSQKPDGKGKLDVQKLADLLFTLGYEFKNREELEAVLAQVIDMTIQAKFWGWAPKDKDGKEKDAIQQHVVKGVGSIAKDESTSFGTVAF